MTLDDLDWKLMNAWQRALPLVPRPFQVMAESLGLEEHDVIERLRGLIEVGAITCIGATCRPETMSTGTLAAMATDPDQVEEFAGLLSQMREVDQVHQRENQWNVWMSVSGPTRSAVDQTLGEIERKTGTQLLDLRLNQAFNIDLGFDLDGNSELPVPEPFDDTVPVSQLDRRIIEVLAKGIEPIERPFERLAQQLGHEEHVVLGRIRVLAKAGILSRVGLIVRRRSLGWRSSALVVFDVPVEEVDDKGRALIDVPGVTRCEERKGVSKQWPYSLYCMIHGRSRAETLDVLTLARVRAGLVGYDYKVLFTTRCFKQTPALMAAEELKVSGRF
ncbi:Lrp/AsnC family transcriptional regulator [Roseovarius phycicola]|uniref:siroheme decarboxylase n=1 Tax=Roseovarius phycicola TaxID=3080976 RepID=A0ABZ2HEX4_9RHOB